MPKQKVRIFIVGDPTTGKTIIANMIEMMFAEHGKGIGVEDPDHHQYKMPLSPALVQGFCDDPSREIEVTTVMSVRGKATIDLPFDR